MADELPKVSTRHGDNPRTGEYVVQDSIERYLLSPDAIARLVDNIAKLLAQKYVDENYPDIVAQVSPKAIATLMTIEAGRIAAGKINGVK